MPGEEEENPQVDPRAEEEEEAPEEQEEALVSADQELSDASMETSQSTSSMRAAASEQSRPRLKIPNLEGKKQYITWKGRYTYVMRLFGYEGILSGEYKCPSGPPASVEEWVRADRTVRAYLMEALVSDSDFNLIRTCDTAHECFLALDNFYDRDSQYKTYTLQSRLQNERLQSGTSVKEHIANMEDLRRQLEGCKFKMEDEHFANQLLLSLPSESTSVWATTIAIMENEQRNSRLSLDGLIAALHEAEEKMKLNKTEMARRSVFDRLEPGSVIDRLEFDDQHPDATETQRSNALKDGRKFKTRPKCFCCGVTGHTWATCWYKPEGWEPGMPKVEPKKRISDKAQVDEKARRARASPDADARALLNLDSGCTWSVVRNKKLLLNYTKLGAPVRFEGSKSDTYFYAMGKGDVVLQGANGQHSILCNVLYAPDASENLLSAWHIAQEGWIIRISKASVDIERDGDTRHQLRVMEQNQGWYVRANVTEEAARSAKLTIDLVQAHRLLGHVSKERVQKLCNGAATGLKLKNGASDKCLECALCNISIAPFPQDGRTRATDLLELVHVDVFGPTEVDSLGGARYALIIVDDFSHNGEAIPLHTKGEAASELVDWIEATEATLQKKLKVLRSDNGGEFMSNSLQSWLRKHGVRHQTTVRHSPQQNGVAERYGGILFRGVRAMLERAGRNLALWAEAIIAKVYLENRLPSTACAVPDKTPHEVWTGKKPDLSHLREFGQKAVIRNPMATGKLSRRGLPVIFVGYSETQKGWRFVDQETNRITVERSAIFFPIGASEDSEGRSCEPTTHFPVEIDLPNPGAPTEQNPVATPSSPREGNSAEELNIGEEESSESAAEEVERAPISEHSDAGGIIPEDSQTYQTAETHQELEGLRRSSRLPKPITAEARDGQLPMAPFARARANGAKRQQELEDEPTDYQEMLTMADKEEWSKAYQAEADSFARNKVYDWVPRPRNKTVIKTRTLFGKKRDLDGNVHKYKVRYVAKGFGQEFGVNVFDTYAPVVKPATFRAVLQVAAHRDYDMVQQDVRTAFLQADLDEEVYIEPMAGVPKPTGKDGYVWKLNKAVYGLKQSPRAWNKRLTDYLRSIGLKQSTADPCLFVCLQPVTYVIVWVDDLLITGESADFLNEVKMKLASEFEMTDLGEPSSMLGIALKRNRPARTIHLCQGAYLKRFLESEGLGNAKAAKTPMEVNIKLRRVEPGCGLDNSCYRQFIGTYLYAVIWTRPDLSFALGCLSQHLESPGEEHYVALERLTRYICGTLDYGLTLGGAKQLRLQGYTDSDWASDVSDRKSYSGYLAKLGDGTINYHAKKQNMVTLSSTEAELVAVTEAAKDTVWLIRLLQDMGLELQTPIGISCDNQATVKLCYNPGQHSRTKHIEVRQYYVREQIDSRKLVVTWISGGANPADGFTKALPLPGHRDLVAALNTLP
jgi:hypothetical protein